MKRSVVVLSFGAALALLGGCAAGGRMVTSIGQGLSSYGEKHDSSLLKAGGKIYQDIGNGIQSAVATDAEKANKKE